MSEIKDKTNKQTKIKMIIEKQTKYCTKIDINNIERVDTKIIKQNLRKAKKKL